MYIEDELWDWIERRCERAYMGVTQKLIEEIIEECGIWFSFDGIRYETENFDMTIEDCCREYWYIIDGNKIKFTNADIFAEELDDYLGL